MLAIGDMALTYNQQLAILLILLWSGGMPRSDDRTYMQSKRWLNSGKQQETRNKVSCGSDRDRWKDLALHRCVCI